MGTVTDAQSKALAMTGAYVGAYNSQGNGIYGLYGYQYYISDAKYGSQLRLHYNTGTIETRTCKAGIWNDWQSYVKNTDFRRGTAMLTRKPNTITSVTVDFSNPFPSTPLIFLCGNTDGPDDGALSVSNVSTTSFRINTQSRTSTSNMSVNWLAIT